MESAIIVALIAGFAGMFASCMTFIGLNYNFNKPKKHNILEMQLMHVFSPIHSILSIQKKLSDEEKFDMIDKIIKEHYTLVHPKIYTLFYDGEQQLFYEQIDKCYTYARAKLGYEQIKVRLDSQTKTMVGSSSHKEVILLMNGIITALGMGVAVVMAVAGAVFGTIALAVMLTVVNGFITAVILKS